MRPGYVVVDVGCGTGLSFPLLEGRIGPDETLIGIEQSPEMLAVARERIARHGWQNVTLIESPVAEARLPARPDAALFCLVHDISRSRAALRNVLSQPKPAGRIVAFGAMAAPRWAFPVRLLGAP